MSDTKISGAQLVLDLPMDEIRNGAIANLALGSASSTVPAKGAPKVVYDYYMGSSIAFYGQESFEVKEVKIPAGQGCTISCWFNIDACKDKSATWQQLFYLKSSTSNDAWGIHTRCQDQGLFLFCFSPTENTTTLAGKIDGDKWMHLALCMAGDGKIKAYINAVLVNEHQNAFANKFITDNKSFFLQIGARQEKDFFHGKISQFKMYAGLLSIDEIKVNMEEGRSANATFKSSYPIDFKLNSIDNGSENPVLYIENNTNGHPFRIDMINTSGTALKFAGDPVRDFTLSENDYHIQLRFKKQVIATDVLDNLIKSTNTNLDGWTCIAGKDTSMLEDWISFKRTPVNANEEFKGLQSVLLNGMRAEAMAGSRNTLVEIRYNNLYYKDTRNILNGSLSRHIDIISHLGKRNAPFDVSITGTSTILNDGKTANSFKLVIRNITGEPIRFTNEAAGDKQSSKFILYTKDPITFNVKPQFANDTFHENPVTDSNLPKSFTCKKQDLVLNPASGDLTITIDKLVTSYASGTVLLYLEYKNIPGYWDGVISVPLHLSRLVERENRIGINTEPAKEYDLHVKGSIKSEGQIFDQTGLLMPVGAIIAYGGEKAPVGWLLCDGQAIPADNLYKNLKDILGKMNTPDLRSRFIVGANPGVNDYNRHDKKGVEKVELKEEHIPKHSHTGAITETDIMLKGDYKVMHPRAYKKNLVDGIHDGTVAFGKVTASFSSSYDAFAEEPVRIDTVVKSKHAHTVSISEYGKGQAHDNMPPYYALTYIIKY